MYTLHKETVVNTTIPDAWEFISNPANLNLLTPPDMNFEIISKQPVGMKEGMLIQYKVLLPLLGRRTWISRLKDIVPRHSFVDEQTKGPYKYWHHHHVIEPVDNGVLFTDKVTYVPPMGPLGKLANTLFIRQKLEQIFDYREQKLHEIFPSNPSENGPSKKV